MGHCKSGGALFSCTQDRRGTSCEPIAIEADSTVVSVACNVPWDDISTVPEPFLDGGSAEEVYTEDYDQQYADAIDLQAYSQQPGAFAATTPPPTLNEDSSIEVPGRLRGSSRAGQLPSIVARRKDTGQEATPATPPSATRSAQTQGSPDSLMASASPVQTAALPPPVAFKQAPTTNPAAAWGPSTLVDTPVPQPTGVFATP